MAQLDEQDVENQLSTVREYLKRKKSIADEISVLKEDLKELTEEFKDKIDLKTLKLALTVTSATKKVAHKFTFDSIIQMIEDEGLA